jgi:hypothetical protein
MPPVLTMGSKAQCMHGGQILLETNNTLLYAGGFPVLLESDIHVVTGCPFTVGPTYMPCVTVQWEAGAVRLAVNGVGVLLASSIGTCLNAAGAPQGIAVVTNPAAELAAV